MQRIGSLWVAYETAYVCFSQTATLLVSPLTVRRQKRIGFLISLAVSARIRRNLDTGDRGMSTAIDGSISALKGHAFGFKLSFRFEPVLDIVAIYPSPREEQFVCS